jgi:hypothetical protein
MILCSCFFVVVKFDYGIICDYDLMLMFFVVVFCVLMMEFLRYVLVWLMVFSLSLVEAPQFKRMSNVKKGQK